MRRAIAIAALACAACGQHPKEPLGPERPAARTDGGQAP